MSWRRPTVLMCLALVMARPAEPQTGDAIARALAEDFFAGRLALMAARFDERVAQALPDDKLTDMRNRLASQVGTFQAITETRAEDAKGYHVVYVTCRFEKMTLDMKIVLDLSNRVAGFSFAPVPPKVAWSQPSYAKPGTFIERDIIVGSGEWQLPGILSLPNGGGPYPAVVLVHGSGSGDQDESIGPNKPFKDIAWGLASRGIAVLRYTKRTLKYPEQVAAAALAGRFTVRDETIDDARAAVAAIANVPDVDRRRIYVLGHSLGGRLAPRIADGTPDIAGLVIMAGGSLPLDQNIVEQIRYLAGLRGVDDGGKAVAAAEAAAREMRSPTLQPTTLVQAAGATYPGSYLIDLREYHPVETAARLRVPLLIIQGDVDYQCTLKNFEAWKAGLSQRPLVSFKLYPGLTHLLMPVSAGRSGLSTPADYDAPQHVSEAVIEDLAAWVRSARD
jgi:dienelactone hydrolase